MKPINHKNPIKLYPDGSMWCALVGKDIQSGHSGFGKSPEEALAKLLEDEDVWGATPHAVYEMGCECGKNWVAVMSYPNGGQAECPQCGTMNPVSSDPVELI